MSLLRRRGSIPVPYVVAGARLAVGAGGVNLEGISVMPAGILVEIWMLPRIDREIGKQLPPVGGLGLSGGLDDQSLESLRGGWQEAVHRLVRIQLSGDAIDVDPFP